MCPPRHPRSKAIKKAEDQSGLTAAFERLDKATDGAVSSFEDSVGITALEEALGIQ